MKNPYALLRERAGYGQREFARKFGYSRNTMIQIDNGMPKEVSERLENDLLEACARADVPVNEVLKEEFGVQHLDQAYSRFQHETRLENASLFNAAAPSNKQTTYDLSPFHFFVKDTAGSLQAFCKKLCIPADQVTRYASGATETIPALIDSALREIRYPYIDKLVSMQADWYGRD